MALVSSREGASVARAMLRVAVDRDEPMTLHDQVAAELRRAIADGEASQGERLPPSSDLAAVLGVNRNTVLRALRLLRDEGVVDFTRGRGVRVTGSPQRTALIARVGDLLEFARAQGYRRSDVVALIEELPSSQG